MNIGTHFSWEVELLDHRGDIYLVLEDTAVSQSTVIICPPAAYESSSWSTFLPTLGIDHGFAYSHSIGCVTVSHGGFNLHFTEESSFWISSFLKCLFRCFADFNWGCLSFSYWYLGCLDICWNWVLCRCAKSFQSCLTLCDSMDCSLPGILCPWDSPGKNTGVGCHALLQGIFLTQEQNSGLLCLLD